MFAKYAAIACRFLHNGEIANEGIHFNFVQILKLKCFNLKTGLLFQVMLVPWWGVRKRKNWNEVRRVAKVSNKFLVVILFFIEHFNHNINLILSFF
jgi:hypothetical protein